MNEDTFCQQQLDELVEVENVPNSWLDEQGVRHAVILDYGLPEEYMRLQKVNGEWQLNEKAPF